MGLFMKGICFMKWPTEKGGLLQLMENGMKDSGLMIGLTDLAFIVTEMGVDMKGNGIMISKMAKELRSGLMVQCIKEDIFKEVRKEKVFISGLTEAYIKGLFKMIIWMDMALIDIKMEYNIVDKWSKIQFKVKVYSFGLMAENTKVIYVKI